MSETERYSTTGVRTRLLRWCSPVCSLLRYRNEFIAKNETLSCKREKRDNFYNIRYHHHHHHHVPLARISLTLSRHFSLSFIASGMSSGLHPVSSHSCCMYVLAGRPAFARPYVGIHRSTPLMSSSLLLQQCPACLVRLTLIVFEMGGRWPYSWCFVRCCRQDLFNIARNILVYTIYDSFIHSFVYLYNCISHAFFNFVLYISYHIL